MKDLTNDPDFLKCFQIIKPSEININKEDIFYRDKYNDIINYLKAILTNHNDNILSDYLSPKGAILININSGTDILDYIELIAKNYYLNLMKFNEIELIDNPKKFLKTFTSIFESFGEKIEKLDDTGANSRDSERIEEKKILLINQQPILKQKFDDNNLLEVFSNIWQKRGFNFNFIESNIILIWLNYDIQDVNIISNRLYDIFDIFIKIPLLNKIERETVLKNFLEKDPKIVFDINDIVNYTENWEVKDITKLLKVGIFKHYLNSELNETSNEITDILIDLIVSGEYIPQSIPINSKNNSNLEIKTISPKDKETSLIPRVNKITNPEDVSSLLKNIQESRISEFMLNQLYENAASKNYTELTIIIDKLSKKESLEENDMKILAKYPFVLNDSPNRAQINLEKAKKRVDLIKQAFGEK